MRGRVSDISGNRFGLLTVLSVASVRGPSKWLCRCDCGTERIFAGGNLRSGRSRSCGCAPITPKHGHAKKNAVSVEYSTWNSMMARCLNSDAPNYENYGGRGITVCLRWRSFENFFADMGPRPSSKHSLDRYPDNDGDYEPDNCRWATQKEQCRNTRSNRIVEYRGRKMSLAEAVEISGLSRSMVSMRLHRGWPVSRALEA